MRWVVAGVTRRDTDNERITEERFSSCISPFAALREELSEPSGWTLALDCAAWTLLRAPPAFALALGLALRHRSRIRCETFP
jgi:hypothetical protein